MNASTAHRPANPLAVFLAGLQAGMIGICWMLVWLGLSAKGQGRSFWTAENLIATVFHGDTAIRRGFGSTTLSGVALFVLRRRYPNAERQKYLSWSTELRERLKTQARAKRRTML